jgi:MFS family permease
MTIADTPIPTARPARPPLFSLSGDSPFHTDPAAMAAYYEDRGLMWRNIVFIGIANLGWQLALGIVGLSMTAKLISLGLGQGIQNSMSTINSGLLAFLVMLFSWMSDHTISRMGRRKPYFFISAPCIILTVMLFPFMAIPRLVWLVLAMQILFNLSMDLKLSTFSLINIDCVPREVLARTNSLFGVIGSITGFFVSYNAGYLLNRGETIPYIVVGCVMVVTTMVAFLIKEPPVYHPPTEKFKPWSTFTVSAADKRIFFLMAGIALIGTYNYSTIKLNSFWMLQDLKLDPAKIFRATSWASLTGVVTAYPIGWIIDRFGGLKVMIVFFICTTACFFFQLHVHTTFALTELAIAGTFYGGLYGAADIMLIKSAPESDVGSITATNGFMRNMMGMVMGFLITGVVTFTHNNFHAGFIVGEVFTCIGMGFFFIYAYLMRNVQTETGVPMQDGIPDTTALPMPDGTPAPDGLLLRDGVLFPPAVENTSQ